jgi:hypothetical protein
LNLQLVHANAHYDRELDIADRHRPGLGKGVVQLATPQGILGWVDVDDYGETRLLLIDLGFNESEGNTIDEGIGGLHALELLTFLAYQQGPSERRVQLAEPVAVQQLPTNVKPPSEIHIVQIPGSRRVWDALKPRRINRHPYPPSIPPTHPCPPSLLPRRPRSKRR